MLRFKTGCHSDPLDKRDIRFGAHFDGIARGEFSVRVDAVRTRVQGRTSTCVGFAVAKALETASYFHTNEPWPELSPLAIYAAARLQHAADYDGDGQITYRDLRDNGTYIRAGMKAVIRVGACREDLHPFGRFRVNKPVPFLAERDGLRRRGLRKYFRIDPMRPAEVRSALASKIPVVGGWPMRQAWANGPATLDDDAGTFVGNHAMVVEACHLDGSFDIWNTSWGTGFGVGGRVRVSERVLMSGHDLWGVIL